MDNMDIIWEGDWIPRVTYIYHKHQLNVGRYTITWILWNIKVKTIDGGLLASTVLQGGSSKNHTPSIHSRLSSFEGEQSLGDLRTLCGDCVDTLCIPSLPNKYLGRSFPVGFWGCLNTFSLGVWKPRVKKHDECINVFMMNQLFPTPWWIHRTIVPQQNQPNVSMYPPYN